MGFEFERTYGDADRVASTEYIQELLVDSAHNIWQDEGQGPSPKVSIHQLSAQQHFELTRNRYSSQQRPTRCLWP